MIQLEGTKEARPGGSGDAASSRPFGSDGIVDPHGRGDLPAGAGVLSSAEDLGRYYQSDRDADS